MKARKTNPFIKAINDQIDLYKREIKLLNEKATKLARDRMLLRALYAPMFAGLTNNDRLHISLIGNHVHFILYMYELNSFKDERLTSILDYALENISTDVTEKDYAEYDHKEYRLQTKDLYFNIEAHVKEDSPTCRKVVTGMEIKEVPKYKYVCE